MKAFLPVNQDYLSVLVHQIILRAICGCQMDGRPQVYNPDKHQ